MAATQQPEKIPIPQGVVARVANGVRGFVAGVSGATWFGPWQPIQPIAPKDMPPRVLDYPPGYNLVTQPRAYEAVSFDQMRALADGYDLLRLVIETRKDQVCKIPWAVRLLPQDGESKRDLAARALKSPHVKQATKLLQWPDGENDWQTWLRELLEDVFVIDAASVVPVRNRGGELLRLEVIDGATIKRVIDADGRTPAAPSVAYQQVLHGLPAVDLSTADLVYMPRNKRSNRLYGYSPVEQVILTVNLALRRQMFQLAYYTEGSVPEAIVQVPETWTPDQIRQFQTWFDSVMAGNIAARRRMTFIPPTGKIDYPKAAALKDEMDEWLARVVCFAFSIPPTPFVRQMNRATAQTAQETALSEGLLPIREWLQARMTYILQRVVGFDDVEFSFQDEASADPATQATVDKTYVSIGVKSVDEVRDALGLDPIGMGNAVMTATGPVPIGNAAEESDDDAAVVDDAEKLAKADELRADPAEVTAAKTKAQAKMRKALAAFLSKRGAALAKQVSDAYAAVKKADGDDSDLDKVMAAIDLGDWNKLVELVQQPLSEAALAAGLAALVKLEISEEEDGAVFDQVNVSAADYAATRAAEMVGMKLVDGDLVPNPDAKWAITESTRDGLRRLVADALTDGMTPAQLKAAVQESAMFSAARARMIARTEIGTAHVQGTLAAWKASGLVGGKRSLLGSEHIGPDMCDLNAAAGVIALDKSFPSGSEGAPFHPNCVCAVIAEKIKGVDKP